MLKSALKLLSGNLLALFLQGVQFVLLARILGAETFGLVSAATALVSIGVPLSDAGFGHVLQRHGSRNPSHIGRLLSNAMIANLIIGTWIVGLTIIAALLVYQGKVPMLLVLVIALSEFFFFRLVWIMGQARAAHENFGSTALYMALTGICRISGVLVLLITQTSDPMIWAISVLIFGAILAIGVFLKNKAYLIESIDVGTMSVLGYWKESVTFAASDMSRNMGSDLDKVMLGRFGGTGILGSYTAASRVMSFAISPIRALLQASRTKLYRHGHGGLAQLKPLLHRIIYLGIPYALVVSIGLYYFAPFIPFILGDSFKSSVDILKLLAFLPLVQLFSFIASDVLASMGIVRTRLKIQIVSNLILLISGYFLISGGDWKGAVLSCYIAEFVLASISWLVVLRHNTKQLTSDVV